MTSVFNQAVVQLAATKKPPATIGRPTIAKQSLQVRVLLMLAHRPSDPLLSSEIARRCKVDRKTVTEKLRKLRATAWVEYQPEMGAWADPSFRAGPLLLELLGVRK